MVPALYISVFLPWYNGLLRPFGWSGSGRVVGLPDGMRISVPKFRNGRV